MGGAMGPGGAWQGTGGEHLPLDRRVAQNAHVRLPALRPGGGALFGPRHEAGARLHVQHHDAQRRAAARLAEDDRGAAEEQRVRLGGGDGEQAVRAALGAPDDADGGELGQLFADALLDEPAVEGIGTG